MELNTDENMRPDSAALPEASDTLEEREIQDLREERGIQVLREDRIPAERTVSRSAAGNRGNSQNSKASKKSGGLTGRAKAKMNAIITVTAVVLVLGMVIAGALTLPSIVDAQSIAAAAGEQAFAEAMNEKRSEVYDSFYKTAFDRAEKQHHVANRALISVDNIRETAVLEVLEVSAADVKEYTFDNEFTKTTEYMNGIRSSLGLKNVDPSHAVVWLEGSCTGVFGVDLNASEIIIDNENQYVLIRIPSPALKFTGHEFNVMYFDNGTPKLLNKIFDGSYQTGFDEAMKDTADMTAELHDTLNKNHTYRDIARESAKTLIENLVRGVNPDIPDLRVDVMFFS